MTSLGKLGNSYLRESFNLGSHLGRQLVPHFLGEWYWHFLVGVVIENEAVLDLCLFKDALTANHFAFSG